jgi:hypothetical protein
MHVAMEMGREFIGVDIAYRAQRENRTDRTAVTTPDDGTRDMFTGMADLGAHDGVQP